MGLPLAAEQFYEYGQPENLPPPPNKGAAIIMGRDPTCHASPLGQGESGSIDNTQTLRSGNSLHKGKGGPEQSGLPAAAQGSKAGQKAGSDGPTIGGTDTQDTSSGNPAQGKGRISQTR